ncbi:MAG: hypothetical protein A2Y33_13660 [Spirochaetes bacterium GWF1_51_8]|nr:MAG: hypothetical protein A2Y33_13660 [Spirochaetes bacterium GWF1_51_8]
MFGGDTFFGRKLKPLIAKGVDLFKDIRAAAKDADICILNLETPISTNNSEPYDKPYVFIADPIAITLLTNSFVNAVSLGNNHMLDYGKQALIDTHRYLDAAGIAYSGAGTNLMQASKPVIFEVNGIKIGYLSFGLNGPGEVLDATPITHGTAPIRLTNILPVMNELRPKVDFLIVSLHDGAEYMDFPMQRVLSNYHAIIDNGADLIIGHHPHVIQGIEKREGGVIFYSMGNLLFDQKNAITLKTMLGSVKITKKLVSGKTVIGAEYSVIPMMRNTELFLPEFAGKKDADAITAHLKKISASLGKWKPEFVLKSGKPYPEYSIVWANKGGSNSIALSGKSKQNE